MEGMSNNIGQKLKKVSRFLLAGGISFFIGLGLLLIVDEQALKGLLVMAGGCFYQWLACQLLCAFGEMVEQVTMQTKHVQKILEKLENNEEAEEIPVILAVSDASDYKEEKTVTASELLIDKAEQDSSNENNENKTEEVIEQGKVYKLTVSAEVVPNLFFSKYDVRVSVDGLVQTTIAHGSEKIFEILVKKGEHIITFERCDGASIQNHVKVMVDKDISTHYRVTCYSNVLAII